MLHNKFTLCNNKMKKIIPYIAFACMAGLTAVSGLPVYAGGCNYKNKSSQVECGKNDKDCNANKIEKQKKFSINS